MLGPLRSPAVLCLALCAFAAGCGGDEDEEPRATATAASTETAPSVRTGTQTTPAQPPAETADRPQPTVEARPRSPEEQPGGAGDEEAIRVAAMFTGESGRISPPLVRVPPFLAIEVELRSKDGGTYSLRAGGKRLRVDADIAEASTELPGLRPGRRLVLRGPAGRVAVEATAEPGP